MQNPSAPHAGDVLVVEDVHAIREVLVGFLADAGFATREAGDGAVALAQIMARRPAVVLLDYWMPVMDGGTLLQLLLGQGISVPMAFITAAPMTVARLHPQATIFEKPIDFDKLLAFVARHVVPSHGP